MSAIDNIKHYYINIRPQYLFIILKLNIAATLDLISSVLERIFLFFLPPHPVANSGPRDVSAVKECFVPLLDSNINPAKSSFRIVDCCKIIPKNNYIMRSLPVHVVPSLNEIFKFT